MSMKIRFYTTAAALMLMSYTSFGQSSNAVLEMTTGTGNGLTVTNAGFGPRNSDHVVTLENDNANNSHFSLFATPTVTCTISLKNQQYTGLTYGAATSNAVPTGLIFGAGPSLSTGGTIQQASPLNSFDILGAFNGSGGPRNGMFTSDPTATPTVSSFPTQSGVGIDARGEVAGRTDINAGVQVFTTAQVLFDQAQPNNAATRYYYGDVVLTFNRFVTDPVIHIAGLGGSYRYLPVGAPTADTSNYLSSYFATEIEVAPGLPLTKMSGNEFFTVSGNKVSNNCVRPNGESFLVTAPDNLTLTNYGAASGSFRINGPVRVVTLRVYLRGSNLSQFNWSSAGIGVVTAATRAPLTGDIWFVSASVKPQQLIPLPATGMTLSGHLNGNDVVLNWKTLTEQNSDHFDIERSADGLTFSPIANKPAAGISNSEINYTQTDANMNANVYYYRVKLVDVDGRGSYTNIVTIKKAGNIKGVRLYPNPVVSNLNIEFTNSKGNYAISLYNLGGQEVMTQKADISYDVQTIPLSKGTLPAGAYYLKIRNTAGSEVYAEKVIIQ
jgi:Secretion system C-terminal sorting domain